MSAGPTPRQPVSLSTFDTTPLFMREAAVGTDRDAPEDDQNTLAALQSLIHEGDPEEVASNFKDQGNGYFKARRFREAMGFYTQGVEALTIQSIDGSPKTVEVQEKDRSLYNALLLNRAAANLELGFIQSCQGLVKLRRYEEALDACDRCLSFDPDNGGVTSIQVIAQKELNVEVNKARQKAEAEEKEKAKKAALSLALQHHGITVLKDNTDPEHLPFLDPPTPPYPTFRTTYMPCQDTLGAHLDSILPDPETGSDVPFAPWDEKQEYISNKVNVYVKTRKGRVLRLGRNKILADICKTAKGKEGEDDGLVIGQGVVAFVVVPKGSLAEEKYLKSVKEERKDKA
ncbi:Tetratricopeptide repeats protein [Rhizoctonia solani]|uniref:Tetratricopeptide repeats protein n=1 Tax=Rhizoctonia solani TaxID=456999 RepID=A0A8H7IMM1_9AGAM|nr:Tetratricopeptide repeats protein [Rhizoctonia solani]